MIRARPSRRGQLGGDVVVATRVRCRDPPRLGLVLRTRGLRLLSVGSGRGVSRCWSTPCLLGRWPINRRQLVEPARSHPTGRPMHAKRGVRTITLGTPSSWPGDMDAPRGTCGTRPIRPVICKRPLGTRSARQSCAASGMAYGVASGRTRTMAGRWGSSTRDKDPGSPYV